MTQIKNPRRTAENPFKAIIQRGVLRHDVPAQMQAAMGRFVSVPFWPVDLTESKGRVKRQRMKAAGMTGKEYRRYLKTERRKRA